MYPERMLVTNETEFITISGTIVTIRYYTKTIFTIEKLHKTA